VRLCLAKPREPVVRYVSSEKVCTSTSGFGLPGFGYLASISIYPSLAVRRDLLHIDLGWELVNLESVVPGIIVLKLVIRYLFLIASQVGDSLSIRTPP
jgi:hypothetical protein